MNSEKTKIIFIGTSEFAVPILEKLNQFFEVLAVVSTPDKPIGRERKIDFSPVKQKALELDLEVLQPEKLKNNTDFLNQLYQKKPELIVVAAYGKILPEAIINLPEHGCLNVHGSLLPKYRGASPIQSALLNGDKETGITIMLMDLGMDTGDILVQEQIEIAPEDDFITLSEKLSQLSANSIIETIPAYINGEINLEIQDDDEATYCQKILPEMGEINWLKSARSINNQIRALKSKINVFTSYNGKRLNIISADVKKIPPELNDNNIQIGQVVKSTTDKDCICVKTSKNYLHLREVKIEGKNIMKIKDFINGHQDFIGTILK